MSHSGVFAGARSRERGYITIALAFAAIFLLGMVGMTIDLGRMYTARTEAQSLVDSAAMDAALKLNDTMTGINRALAAVAANPKKWNFGNSPFTSVTTTFGTTAAGPFLDSASLPDPPVGYYFARVVTHVNLPLWFLPAVVGSSASTVGASAVAGRAVVDTFSDKLFPFGPFSHSGVDTTGCPPGDPGDPFGFALGQRYTFRWGAGNIDPLKPADEKQACPGDKCPGILALAGADTSTRGFILYNSASTLLDLILHNPGFPPLTVGDSLAAMKQGVPPGTKNVEMDALGTRVSQDSDPFSTEYFGDPSQCPSGACPGADSNQYQPRRDRQAPDYFGNLRRIVVVPIIGGPPGSVIQGFAGFFLDGTQADYTRLGGNQPGCAEYIGNVVFGGSGSGGLPSGGGLSEIYKIRLYR